MNKNAQLVINSVLAVAVAVLFFLQLRTPHVAATAASPGVVDRPPAPAGQSVTPPDDSLIATTPIPTPEINAASGGAAAEGSVALVRKVGYVKSGELLEGYKGAKTARAAYDAKLARWEREHQAAVQAFQAAVQQYQAKAAGMLEGQRAEQEQKLQQQEQQVAQRQQQLQQQAVEEEGKLNEQVLGKVNKLLERYGKEHNFDLILVAGNGSVAYGRPALDLTQPVLQLLNAEYAAGKR
ncbi:MAG: OmpH family outer membrane protein [Hymenobacteraceae bacterium]|nr:OmpH family outer membrane protein [Hymenobacteraceae bacterium]